MERNGYYSIEYVVQLDGLRTKVRVSAGSPAACRAAAIGELRLRYGALANNARIVTGRLLSAGGR